MLEREYSQDPSHLKDRLVTVGEETFLPTEMTAEELFSLAAIITPHSHALPLSVAAFRQKVLQHSHGESKRLIPLKALAEKRKSRENGFFVFDRRDIVFARIYQPILKPDEDLFAPGYRLSLGGKNPWSIEIAGRELRMAGYPTSTGELWKNI